MNTPKIRALDAVSTAFGRGLEEACQHLHAMTEFNEAFRFDPVSVYFFPAPQLQNALKREIQESCILEVFDGGALVGYAALLFQPQEARKLVHAILKTDEDEQQLDEQKADVVAEVTNIMVNTCLAHLAEPLNLRLAGGLPAFAEPCLPELGDFMSQSKAGILLLESSFANEKRHILGKVSIAIVLNSDPFSQNQASGMKGL